jgi:tetratricopeptide (TPR) repeat protein
LILDNANDINMFYQRSYGYNRSLALIDYLPSSRYGSIIFTTRTRTAAVKQAGNNIIKIYEMDQVEARKVLEKSLIQTHILNEEESTIKLLNHLTCLPLAIVQAAAFINTNEISISLYISLYENGEDEVINLLSEDFEDQGRYRDTKNPIANTWLISFNQIRLQDQLAADYLSFMSCLLPQRIPESLLPLAQTKIEMVKAIGTLTAYSFITTEENERSFNLHRLVHLATRNWLRKTQSLAAWTERTLSQLANVFPSGDHKERAIWTAYMPHARHVLALPHPLDGDKKAEIKLLSKVGECLHSNGQYFDAEQMHRQRLELCRNLIGLEQPRTLSSMNELGRALHKQGKYFEAEQMHKQTLELRVKVLGLKHPNTLDSMNNLGMALHRQGKYFESEQMHRQELELCRKVSGMEHPDTLCSMNNLGRALHKQGKYLEAEQMHKQTLELMVKVLGLEHPSTLSSMNNLSMALHGQGKCIESEQMHRQELELCRKVSGIEHPNTLCSMNNLGAALHGRGKYFEAEQMHKQTLELRVKVLGLEHPNTLDSMNNLGMALHKQGKYVEAEQMHKQTLELRVKVLGLEHPKTLDSMKNLSMALHKQGKYVEAEQMNRQMQELSVKVLGPEHPDTLSSIIELRRVLDNPGKSAEQSSC